MSKKTKKEPWLDEARQSYELIPKKPFPENWSPRATAAVEALIDLRNTDRKTYTFPFLASEIGVMKGTVGRWIAKEHQPESLALSALEKYLAKKGVLTLA